MPPWERYTEVPKAAAAPWLKYQKPAAPDAIPVPDSTAGPWQRYAVPTAAPKGDKLPIIPPPATFTESVGRGVDILQGNIYAATEAIGEAAGIEGLTEFGKAGRERNLGQVQDGVPRQTFSDIGSVGDFGQWMKETVGEQIPIMAPSMAGAAAGATVGAIGGPLGATVGGLVGAFVPSLVQGVGETQTAIKEKAPEEVAPGWAFAGGSAIAALDSIIPGKIGSRLVKVFGLGPAEEIAKRALTKPVTDGVVKRTAKGTAEGMATEGFTEALQEAIGEVSASGATDQPIDLGTLTGAMIEAGAAGALMGGVAGGASSVPARGAPEVAEPVPEAPPAPAEAVPAPVPGATEELGQEPREPAIPGPIQAPEEITPAAAVSAAPPTREERAILREAGWTDEQVTEMEVEERAEAIAEARSQGVVATSGPQTTEAPPAVPTIGPQAAPEPVVATPQPEARREPLQAPEAGPPAPADTGVGNRVERLPLPESKVEGPAPTPVAAADIRPPVVAAADEGRGEGSGAVERRDAVSLQSRLQAWKGDSAKMADELVGEVGAVLKGGGKVRINVDGKVVEITAVDRGMMADAAGQRWGVLPLIQNKAPWSIEYDRKLAALPLPKATQKPTPKLREELQAKPARPVNLYKTILDMGGMKDVRGEVARGLGLPGHQRARFIRAKGRDPDKIREALAEQGYFPQYGTPEQAVAQSTPDDLYDLIDRFARGEKLFAPEDAAQAATEAQAKADTERARDRIDAEMTVDDEELAERATAIMRDTGVTPFEAIEQASIQLADETYSEEDKAATDEATDIPFFGDEDAQPQRLPEGRERGRPTGEESRGRPGAREGPEDGGEAVPAGGKAEGPTRRASQGVGSRFDFSNPGGGSREAKIGDTTVTYGVGKDGLVEVILIETPRAKRGQGSARRAMETLAREADAAGMRLSLNAEPMDKGVTKPRLAGFYRSLGFQRNKGRKRDFSTRAEFIREPRTRRASQGVKPPSTETVKTADGPREQFVLPGAERVSDAELARRKSAEKLKPKVAQKPADVGLFGDTSQQLDLVEMAKQAGLTRKASIRAYHGSPHDFDRFDMSKIGTGEGAQAYGHGLYFAENESVARNYRDRLSNRHLSVAGTMWPDIRDNDDVTLSVMEALEPKWPKEAGTPPKGALEVLVSKDDRRTRFAFRHVLRVLDQDVNDGLKSPDWSLDYQERQYIETLERSSDPYDHSQAAYRLAMLRALRGNVEVRNPGRIYEAAIAADADEFLDWDKPLSEQPAIMAKLGWTPEKTAEYRRLMAIHDNDLVAQLTNDGPVSTPAAAREAYEKARALVREIGFSPDQKGEAIARGGSVFDSAADAGKADKLRAAGIKGIRYKDAGSRVDPAQVKAMRTALDRARAKGDAGVVANLEAQLKAAEAGTYNYVVFDDALIEIERKYRRDKAKAAPQRPRLTNADKAALKNELAEIVSRIAGTRTLLLFRDQIPVESGTDERYQRDMREAAEAGGYELAQTVGGYYDSGYHLGDDIIAIALANPTYRPKSTAYHESWHRIEQYLLTAPEHRLLAADLAKGPNSALRRLAAQRMGMAVRDPFMRDLPDYEITALAFERYMELHENRATGASGLHIALRRAFDRIVEIIRQARALLTGRGVRSVEDLFARAGKGEMGRRADYIEASRDLDAMLAKGVEKALDRQSVDQAPKRQARFGIARPSGGMAGIPYQASSIQRTRAERILDRVRKISDPTRVKIQDRVLALKRIQEQIERETGIRIPESLDVYTAEALYHGKAGERLVDLKVNFVEPLIEKMRELGVDAKTLDDYLYARHAPERNAEILKIDPKQPAGSGMTDAEAAQIMARLRPQQAALTELARMVDGLTQETREAMVRDGLIDRATADAWAQKYPTYVPLRGFETDEDSEAHARIGRGIDVRGKESQQALGRRSRSDSPLAYLIMQAEQGIIRGEKNRVARTLLRMVQTFTDPDIWQTAKAEVKRRVNPKTGLVESYAVPPAFSKADNLFAVKVGGKTTWIEVKHEGVARALRGASFGDSGGIARAAFRLARGYSMLVTSYSPEFVPTNWARDLQTALINVGDIEAKPAGVRRQIVKDALAAKTIRGILAAQRDPNSSKEYAKWFEEFRHAGGKISFLALNDIQEIKADIDSRLRAADRSKANPWELLKAFGRGVDTLNTAVENSVRLSTYIALRKAGIAQSRAAFIARELTVNFNRKGELSTWLNTAYLFFNASAQGTMRIAQGVARSKSVRRAVMGLAVAGAVMEMMNAFLSPDDDDGEKVYDKIPDWVKERNLIIMNPWGEGYVMIPMPYGFNVPYNAGQQMTAVMRGKRKPLEAALTVAASAWDSFNPMGMAASFTQFLSPTLLDPFIQSDENLSWFGTPIMPFQPPQSHKPDAETYFRSAPESAKALAKWLNEFTGGNVGKPGLIDISPETIEHFVEFAGGGLGRFAVNLSQTVEDFIAGEPIELPDIPFVRRFYGTQTATSAQRNRFFTAWNEADAARYEIQQLAKTGDQESLKEARERNAPLLRAHGPLKAIRKALDDLDDRRDVINLKDMPKEEKRKLLDGIEIRERGLLKRAAEVYGEARQ